MRIRTGTGPDDWSDNIPATPNPPKGFSGSLVTGSPGPMELQRRNQRKSKAKLSQIAKEAA